MRRTKLWLVKGKVWKKDGGNRWATFETREVVIAIDDFADAYHVAEEALLLNYSTSVTHEAEATSIQPFVRADTREQVSVVGFIDA